MYTQSPLLDAMLLASVANAFPFNIFDRLRGNEGRAAASPVLARVRCLILRKTPRAVRITRMLACIQSVLCDQDPRHPCRVLLQVGSKCRDIATGLYVPAHSNHHLALKK
jgi:hypothetical protein